MSDRFYFAAEFKYNNPEHLGGMVIYAPECYATQGSSPDKSSGYLYMEKNGCKMQNDPVFQRDHALRAEHNNTLDPLSYTAFGWQGQTSSVVYVHCIVTACLNILDSNCVAPTDLACEPGQSRRRRAADELVEGGALKTLTISSQPLYFASSTNRMSSSQLVNNNMLSARSTQLAFLFVTTMALLLAKFTYSWHKKNKIVKQTKYEVLVQ
ncbi:uncharacterized protein LOC142344882 [Convolutriloba macropyga]|uniref:uncharacterized protein LOC142344882 n=1 Tax=Convolutriloba macropyga TaxID=536237 RepID=UPI003F521E2B